MLLPGKVVQIPPLASWKEYCSMQGHCSADCRNLFASSSVPAIKGYESAFNVFTLAGTDLAANGVISRKSSNFKKSCLPGEIKPPKWNLSLALKGAIHPPYELLKSLHKHLTGKIVFI